MHTDATGSSRSRSLRMKELLKKAATSLVLIVLVALAIRFGTLVDYKSHNSDRAMSVIPFLFESGNIAHSVADGKGFSSPFRLDTGTTAWMTPVYPLILAAIFKLFGVYTLRRHASCRSTFFASRWHVFRFTSQVAALAARTRRRAWRHRSLALGEFSPTQS